MTPGELGKQSLDCFLDGKCDADLLRRLEVLDKETPLIATRLTIAQSAALTAHGILIVRHLIESPTPPSLAISQAYVYGFQMGHDYVVRHGPLAEG